MTSNWRILVVDDEPEVGELASELLESYGSRSDSGPITAAFEESFDRAVELLADEIFDILVLDIRNESTVASSDAAGIAVFDEVRGRRFIPIVFYTALPHLSENISNPPFVQTVSKNAVDPTGDLERAVEKVIGSGLPRLLRSVSEHLADVARAFMADFVEHNWPDLVDCPEDIAYLLSRRLAVSFEEGAESLAHGLGQVAQITSEDAIHPTRYYVQPPTPSYRTGDLLAASGSREEEENAIAGIWHVILTPSCDLVPRSGDMKIDRVVLARCASLESFDEFQNWKDSESRTNRDTLRRFLTSRSKRQEDRYFYLPSAWNVPDLVVDFQDVVSVPADQLETYEKVASLDSPFAEALSHRFNRYMGRVGMPDLDIDSILHRLKQA